ncbi:MAG: 30S ribosomal protein S7, partial [Kiritimatiellae bacterium]|nr:30S ribosomal protein S7 [Kiritimatiellia bacterium]
MRRRQAIKRVHMTDPRFNSELVAKVVRTLMKSGKKTTAERIVYGAIEELARETGKDPLEVMDVAINNMKPKVEVKSRRVGGATYPVPVEIRPGRQLALALRWMAQYASARRGVPMPRAVALEIIDAYNNTGNVLKKRDDTHIRIGPNHPSRSLKDLVHPRKAVGIIKTLAVLLIKISLQNLSLIT